jgi:hypothetical protein
MHDLTDLERRGIPSVGVASSEFVGAAEAQARSLGFDAAMIFVAHPIQDRTDTEMQTLADQAFADIMGRLCEGDGGAL